MVNSVNIKLHRDLIADNLCPVCGYEMEEPSKDYNICPSCGTEFGLHDANASIEQLRAAWIKTGPKWWSTTDEQPSNWNPFELLARLHSYAGYSLATHRVFMMETTSTGTFNQADDAIHNASMAIAFAIQPAGKSLEVTSS
jgi:hypothetical protein